MNNQVSAAECLRRFNKFSSDSSVWVCQDLVIVWGQQPIFNYSPITIWALRNGELDAYLSSRIGWNGFIYFTKIICLMKTITFCFAAFKHSRGDDHEYWNSETEVRRIAQHLSDYIHKISIININKYLPLIIQCPRHVISSNRFICKFIENKYQEIAVLLRLNKSRHINIRIRKSLRFVPRKFLFTTSMLYLIIIMPFQSLYCRTIAQ